MWLMFTHNKKYLQVKKVHHDSGKWTKNKTISDNCHSGNHTSNMEPSGKVERINT